MGRAPEADLWVAGGTVLTPEGPVAADVLTMDGRVEALVRRDPGGRPAGGVRARERIDAGGCWVLPGAVDAHVHFREPGLLHKEDWEHASAAAVAGGVTTVLDMPNTVPPTTDGAALRAKAAAVAGRSRCHYGFYGGMAAGGLRRLEGLAAAGAIGFKVFLAETTAALEPPGDGELLELLREAARLGLRTMVHAENPSLLAAARAAAPAAGLDDLRRHGLERPAIAEREAVARVCLLAQEAGAAICLAHLSTAGAVAEVRRRKAEGGADLRAETCPHYLLLTEAEAVPLGALAKVNPPLRGPADVEALWRALDDGTVDAVGSDHAPHAPEEKDRDLPSAAAGFAGVQHLVAFLWAEVARGRLTLPRLVELCCEAPARAWGLWPRKGRLAPGADADLAVWRPGAPPELPRQWSRNPDGPLLRLRRPGATLVATVVGGRVAFRDGAPAGPPAGTWVLPAGGAAPAGAWARGV